jgi:hypothetical protein
MATLRLALAVPYLATNNAAKLQKTPTDQRKEEVMTDIGNLFQEIAGGKRQTYSGQTPPSLILSLDQNATAATGQVVMTGSLANNGTVQVGGITFTGKTGTPSGSTQFKCGVSATADGAAFAAAVNAHPTTSLYVSAINASGTVTLTTIGNAIGLLGNGVILSSSDGTNAACTAFASGAEDTGKQTYSF